MRVRHRVFNFTDQSINRTTPENGINETMYKDHRIGNMVEVAADYFEKVNAPDKKMIYADRGYGSPMLRAERLSEFIHRIAEKQNSK